MLILAGTDLPPPRAQGSETYSRRCCNPPLRKAKATVNCRAPVVCLATVPVSCLDTAAVPGGGTFPRPHSRPRPLVLGHRLCLVLGHSSVSYGLVCCDVTEQQCLTTAVCVTAPASCFDTADALGNVGQLGHECFSPRPDNPS